MVLDSYQSYPKYNEIFPGVPENYKEIKTLRDVLEINYKHVKVDRQIRGNLINLIKKGENPYKGIIGYDDDVIPSINRGILAGHDLLLVGQIGQAKTKLAESISKNLLSPIPIIIESLTNDIPTTIRAEEMISLLEDKEILHYSPRFTISKETEDNIRNNGLDTKIEWISGSERYRYLLATPDISVKDLVGQIDAIKIAKKGVEIYNIESYSPGQLLQARHGILCIDELPVLDPRKQVSLLSVLQEGKFTTGAYPVYFEPDLKIIATSNPIDYTHSGKIIEPLFDRLRSHIETRYPTKIIDEMLIAIQEIKLSDPKNIILPIFILKTIVNITQLARTNSDINQDKGVSVRMSVHSLEAIVSEAERVRALIHNVKAVPRFSDIHSIQQTSKFELSELDDTNQNRIEILNKLVLETIKNISREYLQHIDRDEIGLLKNEFDKNKKFIVSQKFLGNERNNSLNDYENQLKNFPTFLKIMNKIVEIIENEKDEFTKNMEYNRIDINGLSFSNKHDKEYRASIVELVLEGLRNLDNPIVDRREKGIYETHK
ncbi:MAG: putative Mg-chelatase subunit [Nitrososphaeraceae archaeon]|nr:putative Mg-chelatase subunit [Nitrososphaeraceae archaeon]